MAAAGLLLVTGTLVLCRATLGCFLNGFQLPLSTSNIGDENMPATHASRVQHATDSTFRSLVLDSAQPVLVDFYADWCGPCQRLAPVLEELAAENPQASVVKVNVDQCPELAQRYRIESIPSLKVFKNGQVANETMGLANKRQLQALLAE
jgi:thioredoxin 1